MREIKFRGKSLEGQGWVHGSLFHDTRDNTCHIWDENLLYWLKVDPATVGQYIGLKDKNGRKIYEGDLVEYYNESLKTIVCGIVEYVSGWVWMNYGAGLAKYMAVDDYPDCGDGFDTTEVVGNIHDNPELLK